MKELTQHQTNELNMALKVYALGPRNAGGAYSFYEVSGFQLTPNAMPRVSRACVELQFQDGPVDQGINGITHEALLAILADRLRDFQNGAFANKHNAAALACIEEALTHLHARTLERQARGVEGTHGL